MSPSVPKHLVVDGSNIATEGRSLPSLQQLDEAVRAIMAERPYQTITVIVDATFAHRIDSSEKDEFEKAVEAGEIIIPPAGVVGRGDTFILQVADKAEAAVLSNDSFQEFHGEHEWLFDEGRLVGGKPIEQVGFWVFVDRVPVRGPASRRAVRESKKSDRSRSNGSRRSGRSRSRSTAATPKRASGPPPVPTAPPPGKSDAKVDPGDDVEKAPKSSSRRRSSSTKTDAPAEDARPPRAKKSGDDELNDRTSFLSFVSKHSIGDSLNATVDRYSSHGCYVEAAGAQCYLPSKSMGDPPPSKARDVVSRNQLVTVRVVSLDAERRGINVELVDVDPDPEEDPSPLSDANPHDSAAEADDSSGEVTRPRSSHVATKKSTAKKAANTTKRAATATKSARATKTAAKAPAKRTAAKKAPAKKAVAKKAPAKKAVAKKAPAKRAAAKKAPAKKAVAKKTVAKKAPAKRTAAKKAPAKRTAAKKAPAKKAVAKKTVAKKAPAKRTAAKKAVAKKTVAKKAPAKRTAAKKAPAKKAVAKKAPAKRTAAKKAPAKKAVAKKAPAKRTAAKKAPAKRTARRS